MQFNLGLQRRQSKRQRALPARLRDPNMMTAATPTSAAAVPAQPAAQTTQRFRFSAPASERASGLVLGEFLYQEGADDVQALMQEYMEPTAL